MAMSQIDDLVAWAANLPGAIPVELRNLPQWVTWKREFHRKGKPTKVPYIAGTDKRASTTDARTWCTFGQALNAYYAGRCDGIGFVLTANDPYTGVDLDHCVDVGTHVLTDAARSIIEQFNTYAEWSPSGEGVHIWIRGRIPRERKKVGDYEAYSEKRFLTMTGHQLSDLPDTILERQDALNEFAALYLPERLPPVRPAQPFDGRKTCVLSDDEIIAKASGAQNGAKFQALWGGNASGYPSPSEADITLCMLLAFWTGRDGARIDSLFRRSGLMRDKWDERHGSLTYGQRTIERAMIYQVEVYTPPLPSRKRHEPRRPSGAPVPGSFGQNGGDDSEVSVRETCAQVLMRISGEYATLFHTPEGQPMARVLTSRGRYQILAINESGASGFRSWLIHQYRETTGLLASTTAVVTALEHLRAEARQAGPVRNVYTRIGTAGGNVYVDLCNEDWEVVEISATGWRIIQDAPVWFIRHTGMLPIPTPERGGSINELRKFINVTDESWPLVAGWLVGAFCPTGPYPILAINGASGTAKTSTSRYIRALVDPSVAPVSTMTQDVQSIIISASNGWVLVLDNLSYLSQEMSDTLCGIATGTASRRRALFTDNQESIVSAMRPVVFNGIPEVGTSGDMVSRCLLVELEKLERSDREREQVLNASFANAHARILGALLDAVSCALANGDSTQKPPQGWPRMADFAHWVISAETALGLAEGAFMAAYDTNQEDAQNIVLDASPVAKALADLMEGDAIATPARARLDKWQGSPSQLHHTLTPLAGDYAKGKHWPQNARALSGHLTRIEASMRSRGFVIRSGKSNGARLVTVTREASQRSDQQSECERDAKSIEGTQNRARGTQHLPLAPLGETLRDADFEANRDARDAKSSLPYSHLDSQKKRGERRETREE